MAVHVGLCDDVHVVVLDLIENGREIFDVEGKALPILYLFRIKQ